MLKGFMHSSKITKRFCAAIACAVVGYKSIETYKSNSQQSSRLLAANYSKRLYPVSAEYPDLKLNRNLMAKYLTPNLYAKLRDKQTPNGYTIDEAIQPGVDNIGKVSSVGVVAGDEDTYTVFNELFDKIIEARHFGYKSTQLNQKDLTSAHKLTDASFDPNYVVSLRLRTIRNLHGYSLPAFCSRGERRDIESLVVRIFYNFDSNTEFKYHGTYFPIGLLDQNEEKIIKKEGFWLERPYLPVDISATFYRDWPDSRGVWINDEKNLSVFLNRKDHLYVVVKENTSDFKRLFHLYCDFLNELESHLKQSHVDYMYSKHLGYLSSTPSNLGTCMKLSAHLKLKNLCRDGRLAAILKKIGLNSKYRLLDENNKEIKAPQANDKTIVEIATIVRIGKTELQIAQEFSNSINYLIELDKRLENGGNLNDAY